MPSRGPAGCAVGPSASPHAGSPAPTSGSERDRTDSALCFLGGGSWLARCRTAAIMAKVSITSETCRCHPCQERVSLWASPSSVLAVSNAWRVGRRSFTSGLSQNGAGASRLTPLPPSSRSASASSGCQNGFGAAKVSSCCQLDVDDNRLAQPLCSGRMTGLHRSYGLVRPRAPHWNAPLVVIATRTSPLASERQGPAVPHESPDQTRASSGISPPDT